MKGQERSALETTYCLCYCGGGLKVQEEEVKIWIAADVWGGMGKAGVAL